MELDRGTFVGRFAAKPSQQVLDALDDEERRVLAAVKRSWILAPVDPVGAALERLQQKGLVYSTLDVRQAVIVWKLVTDDNRVR